MKNKMFIVIAVAATILAFSTFTLAQQEKCAEVGSIISVTKARSGHFETVTFLVNSTDPNYNVKTSHPPFTYSESDTPVHIRGKYFKTIQFQAVYWTCKIAENFKASTMTIMGVKNTEQFEGYVSYTIGYRQKSKYVGTTRSTSGGKTKVIVKFKR